MSDWQERLGEAMEARDLSGGELARRSGFTAQYINSLRKKGRGARLPLETAQRLAQALGVTVDWLTRGEGPREPPRLSDVYPIHRPSEAPAPDPYPARAEVIALLSGAVEPSVLAALRAAVIEASTDPGRDYWIDYAKDLARILRRIKADPDFQLPSSEPARAPASGPVRNRPAR